ncbi:MAG: T9SS type A sorting domain-containing protein [Flavobacterium sp.]
MRTLIHIIFFLFFICVHGQPQVDPTFNSNDLGFNNGDGINSIVPSYIYSPIKKIASTPDGKLLYSNSYGDFFARLNPDGTNDTNFNTNVNVAFSSNAQVNDFGCQSDGKIIVIGYYTNNRLIVRLNTDGTVDNTFNSFTGSNNVYSLRDFVVQPDGKIVVVGLFTSFYNVSCNNIFRLNTDGSIDTTFNVGGVGALFGNESSYINTIELLPNGKMLILGNFGAYNGVSRNNMAVLNLDGSLDANFNPGSGFVYESSGTPSSLNLLAIQPDGKFYVSGKFSTYNGTVVNRLIRISSDGSLDTSFSTGTGFQFSYLGPLSGSLFYDEGDIYCMVIQSDGKLVIGGNFESYNGVAHRNIMRLNADGSIDASYHNGKGTWTNPSTYLDSTVRRGEIYKMVTTPDGRIIIAGGFNWYNYALTGNLARLEANGELDLTFNQGTGFNNAVKASLILPDGKIMVAGNFTKYFGADRKGVVRLNNDGSIDMSFNIGAGVEGILSSINQNLKFGQLVNAMDIQPSDNKVLIGGYFKAFNGVVKQSFVRLNTDGSVDTSFDVPIIDSANNTVNTVSSLKVLNDGRVLAIINNRLVRLNSDGTVDAAFTSPSSSVREFRLMPDGRFYALLGSTLKRYLSNGVIDPSFQSVTTSSSYGNDFKIDLLSDGRIILAGSFSSVNSMNINKLARINTDGTLDLTFYPSISFFPNMIKIMPNDKIFLGEKNVTGNQEINLYKLSTNGSLETTYTHFGLHTFLDQILSHITVDEGKVYLGGSFVSAEGVGRNRFARFLDPDVTLSTNLSTNDAQMSLHPIPVREMLTIELSNNLMIDKVEVYNNLGQLIMVTTNIDDGKVLNVSQLQSGVHFLKLYAEGQQVTRKFLKE